MWQACEPYSVTAKHTELSVSMTSFLGRASSEQTLSSLAERENVGTLMFLILPATV